MSVFNEPHFTDENAARDWFEQLRWPEGPVCPHCGSINHAYRRAKPGVLRCGEKECRKDFTVTTKSVMESSHIPLHKWAQAFHLIASSKKGFSAHQLHRTLKITYRSAWFMAHRLREAMRAGGLAPMGGSGKVVEADETVFGFQKGANLKTKRSASQFRNVVLTLVERGGSARSFHVDGTTVASLLPIIRANINRETNLMTDEGPWYTLIGKEFASHDTVKHTEKEYVRGTISTNTVEGYYSIFKRGMKGVYQHCAEKHLHRYLAEYDFRYSNRAALGVNDTDRAALAVKGAAGKRLTYRGPNEARLQPPS
jgi:transposase-like protein